LENASNKFTSLALFLIAVVGGGMAMGFFSAPGEWYAALTKPSFNPPNWVFGPVWTILYVFIAIAGWRTWQRDRSGQGMKVWFVQMGLNFLWSPLFFTAHLLSVALIVIVMMFVAIASFITSTWSRDRIASLLFVPYLLWVSFASVLNASLLMLNF